MNILIVDMEEKKTTCQVVCGDVGAGVYHLDIGLMDFRYPFTGSLFPEIDSAICLESDKVTYDSRIEPVIGVMTKFMYGCMDKFLSMTGEIEIDSIELRGLCGSIHNIDKAFEYYFNIPTRIKVNNDQIRLTTCEFEDLVCECGCTEFVIHRYITEVFCASCGKRYHIVDSKPINCTSWVRED